MRELKSEARKELRRESLKTNFREKRKIYKRG